MKIAELPDGRVRARPVALRMLANLGWRDEGHQLVCPICSYRVTRKASGA